MPFTAGMLYSYGLLRIMPINMSLSQTPGKQTQTRLKPGQAFPEKIYLLFSDKKENWIFVC
jgi:hypothetical protein